MISEEIKQRKKYQKRFFLALEAVRETELAKGEKMPANKLVGELKKLGYEVSPPSFSRAKKKDPLISLSMYVKIVQALDAYLKEKAGLVYDEAKEEYISIKRGVWTKEANIQSTYHPSLNSFREFPYEEIKKAIRESQIEIVFLQSYFSFLDEINEDLKKAIRDGRKVRILLPRPDSSFLQRRKKELIEPEARQLDEKMVRTFEILRELKNVNPSGQTPEVRFLEGDVGTSINFVRIDHHIYQGYYWKETPLTQGPIELKRTDGFVGTRLLKHFEDLWENDGKEAKGSDFHRILGEITPQDRTPIDQNFESSVYFRCYYYHRLMTRQFVLKVEKAKETSGYHSEIIKSESGSTYEGRLEQHELNENVLIWGSLVENGNGGICKSASISLLLDKDDSDILKRKTVFGTFSTQDLGKEILICSRFIMIALDEDEKEKPELASLDYIQKKVGLSKLYIQRYIQENYLEVRKTEDLMNPQNKLTNESLDQRLAMNDIQGIYRFYSILKESNQLRQGWLKIKSNSVLWIPGYESSYDKRSEHEFPKKPERIYQCNVKLIGKDLIFINTDDKMGEAKYFAVLKYSQIEPGILRGTYAGFRKKSQGLHVAFPRGGRIMAVKQEEKEILGFRDDNLNELYPERQIDEWLFDQYPDVKEMSWFGQEVDQLDRSIKGFREFFSGLKDNFIENPSDLIAGKNWIKLPPGDPLSEVAGIYDWYYKSSAEKERGGIRKLIMKIEANGEVSLLEKFGNFFKGMAIRYGNHILIWQFQLEPEWTEIRSKLNFPYSPVHFQGIFSLYLENKNPSSSQVGNAMMGLLLEYSRTKEPLARKVILLPSDISNNDIKQTEPTIVPLGRIEYGFSEQEKKVLTYLNNEQFHFIKTQKEYGRNFNQNDEKQVRFKEGFYKAAEKFAQENNLSQAMVYLDLAMRFGLTLGDINSELYQHKDGIFHKIQKRIINLFSTQ